MRKHLSILIVLTMILVMVIGCTADNEPEPTPTPTPSPSPGLDQQPEEGDDQQDETSDTDDEPSTPEGIPDGEYEAQSDKDERGGYGVVKLTVENEEITDVVYEEYDGDDELKSRENGYEYEEALAAMEDLPEQLVSTQNVDDVDDYSGATGTSDKFRTATRRALASATEGDDVTDDDNEDDEIGGDDTIDDLDDEEDEE